MREEIITRIVCDECGSDRVEHFAKEKPRVQMYMMMDYVKLMTTTQAVHAIKVYTTMVLLCKDCGHRVEYTV